MNIHTWLKNQWDRTLAAVSAIAGVIFLILGWLGASDSELTTQQIPYIASGAVAGLFALGIAATLWLSADLRDEWLKLDQMHQTMQEQTDTRLRAVDPLAEDVEARGETSRRPRLIARDR